MAPGPARVFRDEDFEEVTPPAQAPRVFSDDDFAPVEPERPADSWVVPWAEGAASVAGGLGGAALGLGAGPAAPVASVAGGTVGAEAGRFLASRLLQAGGLKAPTSIGEDAASAVPGLGSGAGAGGLAALAARYAPGVLRVPASLLAGVVGGEAGKLAASGDGRPLGEQIADDIPSMTADAFLGGLSVGAPSAWRGMPSPARTEYRAATERPGSIVEQLGAGVRLNNSELGLHDRLEKVEPDFVRRYLEKDGPADTLELERRVQSDVAAYPEKRRQFLSSIEEAPSADLSAVDEFMNRARKNYSVDAQTGERIPDVALENAEATFRRMTEEASSAADYGDVLSYLNRSNKELGAYNDNTGGAYSTSRTPESVAQQIRFNAAAQAATEAAIEKAAEAAGRGGQFRDMQRGFATAASAEPLINRFNVEQTIVPRAPNSLAANDISMARPADTMYSAAERAIAGRALEARRQGQILDAPRETMERMRRMAAYRSGDLAAPKTGPDDNAIAARLAAGAAATAPLDTRPEAPLPDLSLTPREDPFAGGLPRSVAAFSSHYVTEFLGRAGSNEVTLRLAETMNRAAAEKDERKLGAAIAGAATLFPQIFAPGMGVDGKLYDPQERGRYMDDLRYRGKSGALGNNYETFLTRQQSAFNDEYDLRVLPVPTPTTVGGGRAAIRRGADGVRRYPY